MFWDFGVNPFHAQQLPLPVKTPVFGSLASRCQDQTRNNLAKAHAGLEADVRRVDGDCGITSPQAARVCWQGF